MRSHDYGYRGLWVHVWLNHQEKDKNIIDFVIKITYPCGEKLIEWNHHMQRNMDEMEFYCKGWVDGFIESLLEKHTIAQHNNCKERPCREVNR